MQQHKNSRKFTSGAPQQHRTNQHLHPSQRLPSLTFRPSPSQLAAVDGSSWVTFRVHFLVVRSGDGVGSCAMMYCSLLYGEVYNDGSTGVK